MRYPSLGYRIKAVFSRSDEIKTRCYLGDNRSNPLYTSKQARRHLAPPIWRLRWKQKPEGRKGVVDGSAVQLSLSIDFAGID